MCIVLLGLGAAGYSEGANGALAVVLIAAGYGIWRFVTAYRLTGSMMGLGAAAVSAAWCAAAAGAFVLESDNRVHASAAGSVGILAVGGFGLSRSRHWNRLSIGLWLPSAIDAWRRGDVAPLEQMLESACGDDVASHAARTAALARTLAEALSLTEEEAGDVVLAALVQPLGAVALREEATPCFETHRATIRAADLLERIPSAAGAAIVLRQFDERWDGSGPGGLSGEQVHIGSRLLAAVHAFDHASPGGMEGALAAVRAGSGTAFDPVVTGELIHFFRVNSRLAAA
jgi:hypothetical protein